METTSGPQPAPDLAAAVAARLERLVGLYRWLSPAQGISLTMASTLAMLERSGPSRLTALAAAQGVTQPAMTQGIARLEDAGLVTRAADPGDGRAVQVAITEGGRALLARRRAVRAERVAVLLASLGPAEQAALAAALPAIDALASARRDGAVLPAQGLPAQGPRERQHPAGRPA